MAKKNKVTTSGMRSLMSGPKADDTEQDTPPAQVQAPTQTRRTYGRGQKSADPRTMVGAGVKASEKADLQAMADAEGVTLNALLAFFIRDAMGRYRAGKMKIPRKTISVIDSSKR